MAHDNRNPPWLEGDLQVFLHLPLEGGFQIEVETTYRYISLAESGGGVDKIKFRAISSRGFKSRESRDKMRSAEKDLRKGKKTKRAGKN